MSANAAERLQRILDEQRDARQKVTEGGGGGIPLGGSVPPPPSSNGSWGQEVAAASAAEYDAAAEPYGIGDTIIDWASTPTGAQALADLGVTPDLLIDFDTKERIAGEVLTWVNGYRDQFGEWPITQRVHEYFGQHYRDENGIAMTSERPGRIPVADVAQQVKARKFRNQAMVAMEQWAMRDEVDPVASLEHTIQELQAVTKTVVKPDSATRFMTAAELCAMAPVDVPWIAEPLLAIGCTTQLDGHEKRGGKTTMLLAMSHAIVTGSSFLDKPVKRGPVVYLTEQGTTSFAKQVRNAGLEDSEDFHLMTWPDNRDLDWSHAVRAGAEKCREVGASVLVIDTVGRWSSLGSEGENQSGAVRAATEVILEVASSYNLAIMLSRHSRRAGGEIGESYVGSHAWGAEMDQLVTIQRTKGLTKEQRKLASLGRLDANHTWVIELGDEGYFFVREMDENEIEEGTGMGLRQVLSDVIPGEEQFAISAQDACRLVNDYPETQQTWKYETIRKTLGDMFNERMIRRNGAGTKNDMYRYWLAWE